MTALTVLWCGPGTTIQDHGRFGWQRFGVGPAGAMDRVGLAMANALVGNGPGAAGIEMALAGARFRVEHGTARIAVAGADQPLKIDGVGIAPLTAVSVNAGQIIEIGTARAGQFGYFAVAGGLAVKPQLGSMACHTRADLGGIDGRALREGDHLPLQIEAPVGEELSAASPITPASGPIRVILGPQDDYFSAEGIATLLSAPYTVTPQADRMGIRLSGAKIEHGPKGYNIVSDGIVTGSIQVPGMGEPLILLADRQTTGGYPKIATVISADLGRLAQMQPGSVMHFQAVRRDEALTALRAQLAALDAFRLSLRPARRVLADSAELLALNLVDGWIDASSPD
jgi:biotin-dependent carboxylase-like uncharacterized protein